MNPIRYYIETFGMTEEFAKRTLKIEALAYKRNEALRKRVAREIDEYEQKIKKTEVQKNGAEVQKRNQEISDS